MTLNKSFGIIKMILSACIILLVHGCGKTIEKPKKEKGQNSENNDVNSTNITSCKQTFSINNLVINACTNSGSALTEKQIINGLGETFTKTFDHLDKKSFEDTGGKKQMYGFSDTSKNEVAFSTFFYPDDSYYYGFDIESDQVLFKYNSGNTIKIGDALDKVSLEFSSKVFKYNKQQKSATIYIINESYLTFYFNENLKLSSISFNYQPI